MTVTVRPTMGMINRNSAQFKSNVIWDNLQLGANADMGRPGPRRGPLSSPMACPARCLRLPLRGATMDEPPGIAQKVTTLSYSATAFAASTGVPNLAFFPAKSSSVTPRARAQRPQTVIGTSWETRKSISSLSGGIPTPCTCSAIWVLINVAASPIRVKPVS